MIKGNILGGARSATLTAVITRADGTVEELGTVAHWDSNPLKRWAWVITRSASRLFADFQGPKGGVNS